jgi:hypothetical protein
LHGKAQRYILVVGCGVGAAEVLAASEVAVGAGIGVAAGPPQAKATPMRRAIATIQTGSGAVSVSLLSKVLKLTITLLKLLSARCN